MICRCAWGGSPATAAIERRTGEAVGLSDRDLPLPLRVPAPRHAPLTPARRVARPGVALVVRSHSREWGGGFCFGGGSATDSLSDGGNGQHGLIELVQDVTLVAVDRASGRLRFQLRQGRKSGRSRGALRFAAHLGETCPAAIAAGLRGRPRVAVLLATGG